MALPLHVRPPGLEPRGLEPTGRKVAIHSDPPATEALLAVAGPEATGPAPNFDGADLSAAGLGERIRGASWWDAEFGGARLRACDLAAASLRSTELSGADLAAANLTGASYGGILLYRARLEEANFQGADLIGGILTEVDAGEANCSDTLLEDADLRGARLRFANFGAVMDGADFSDSEGRNGYATTARAYPECCACCLSFCSASPPSIGWLGASSRARASPWELGRQQSTTCCSAWTR